MRSDRDNANADSLATETTMYMVLPVQLLSGRLLMSLRRTRTAVCRSHTID
jgi:hypothetical protein